MRFGEELKCLTVQHLGDLSLTRYHYISVFQLAYTSPNSALSLVRHLIRFQSFLRFSLFSATLFFKYDCFVFLISSVTLFLACR